MTRAGAVCCVLLAVGSVCACANILGIDDGVPRSDDASFFDSSVDVSTIPDTSANDAAVDVVIDVPTSPLSCGTSTCNALQEGCCRSGNPSDASAESFRCVSDASDCDGGLLVTCDEPANCTALGHAGDVCCAVVPDGGSIATSTQCVPNGACNGALLCKPGDDEDCNFDAGQTCKASVATILGYTICKL